MLNSKFEESYSWKYLPCMSILKKINNKILPLKHISENRLFQEWAKSYFGVFSETGFADDPMYPAYYDNGLEIRKNEGCNITAKDSQDLDSVAGYMAEEHHQYVENYIDQSKNISLRKFQNNEVRIKSTFFHF